ncbi:MAG TPA: heavy metal-responsive transcriptional regulator [Actinomycetota bacterium]|nr:heavy metal-responsive transcriptional regulator [Actinomycetota bacterium]
MLTVSRLARSAGVRPDTIRYYDREGLLPVATRTPSGYRVYEEDAVRRLRFIRGSQRLGLRLREIKGLLAVIDRGTCPCGHARAVLDERLAEIDRQLAQLSAMRAELVRVSEKVGPDTCTPGVWPCEEELIEVGGGDASGP